MQRWHDSVFRARWINTQLGSSGSEQWFCSHVVVFLVVFFFFLYAAVLKIGYHCLAQCLVRYQWADFLSYVTTEILIHSIYQNSPEFQGRPGAFFRFQILGLQNCFARCDDRSHEHSHKTDIWNSQLTSRHICETKMINDLSTCSCSQKALEVAHFSKTSPSDTAKKSRRSVRKTRQLALVAFQAAPTGTISIFPPSPFHIYTLK